MNPWPEEGEASIINVWTLVRFVHVLSARAWVGGQLLLSLLVLPVLRRRIDPASRAPLTREVGVRFGVFALAIFLPVQVATGIALAAHRGVTVADLAEPGYGRTLGEKLVLFAVVLGISGIHGVAVGPGQGTGTGAVAGPRALSRSVPSPHPAQVLGEHGGLSGRWSPCPNSKTKVS